MPLKTESYQLEQGNTAVFELFNVLFVLCVRASTAGAVRSSLRLRK
jgi:hypothetical protein